MKTKVTVLLIALAAIVFVVGDAKAASWYVDNAVAASGNGQSWATAFKNFSNSTKAPYIYYNGTSSPAASWIAAKEPLGKTSAPTFVSYSPKNINNNLHLASTDNVAKDAGVSLGSYFTTDKDGITRPQGSAWNIGAYE